MCQVAYDAGTGVYRLLMPGTIATGEIVPDAGSTAPAGYLQCFGQAISRAANYAGLFAVIGTTYGAGDGSTTFNVPDLRGIVVAGKDNMGGTERESAEQRRWPARRWAPRAASKPRAPASAVSVSVSVGGSASGTLTGGTGDATCGRVRQRGGRRRRRVHSPSFHRAQFCFREWQLRRLGLWRWQSVSGGTSVVSNVQPTIILNQIIKL